LFINLRSKDFFALFFGKIMTVRLYIAAPIFGKLKELVPRTRAIEKWFHQNLPRMTKDFGIDYSELFTPAPGMAFELDSGVTLNYSELVPKGLAVRMALLAALDGVDRHSVEERADAYFIQIDGSGAFDFEATFEVLGLLFKGHPIVLGQRTGEKWFMSHKDRKCVELFENFLVETWVSENGVASRLSWPDAQAGCWGLRLSELQYLPLTAPGYELEIDLFASALMSRRSLVFTRPLTEGKRIGGSGMQLSDGGSINYQPSISKIRFLTSKLAWDRAKIRSLLLSYQRAHPPGSAYELPKEYVQLLDAEYFVHEVAVSGDG
jgi:hypothetical protein